MRLSTRLRLLVIFAVLCLPLAALGAPRGTLRYDVTADPAARRFHVQITLDPGSSDWVRFEIPAWSPGFYIVQSYQRGISGFNAVDGDGRPVTVTHPSERTWRVAPHGAKLVVGYDVDARDPGFGFFGSHLDDATGYINGASALMYPADGKELPDVISYHLPDGWKLATPLDPGEEAGTYRAHGYDEFIDCPAQMGAFDRLDFTVQGVPFSAILVGANDADRGALTDALTRISKAGMSLFGSVPFRRYMFFYHFAVGGFGGGLEHRSSCVMTGTARVADDMRAWMWLSAHEYLHAWNIKRIHPSVLGPFDYQDKVRTHSLWFGEGVTDYYALLVNRMAGLLSASDLMDEYAKRIHQLQQTPARTRVSAEEASWKTWEGGSIGYDGLSYYLKGSLLGLMLDIEIRNATDNRRSLDDVMRYMDAEYGAKGRGYGENAILDAINQVSERDMSALYNRYVRKTNEIPWNEELAKAGLRYEEGRGANPYLGVGGLPAHDGVLVETVVRESPADAAGLRSGDTIVSLNGVPVSWDTWRDQVAKLKPGEQARLAYRRNDAMGEVNVRVGEKRGAYYRLATISGADERATQIRVGLLRLGVPPTGQAEGGR